MADPGRGTAFHFLHKSISAALVWAYLYYCRVSNIWYVFFCVNCSGCVKTYRHVQPSTPPGLQSMVLTSMVLVMDLMSRLHYSSPATSHQLFIRLALLYRYTCKNNSWRCNGLIGLLRCVCVCVCVCARARVSSSGGDASVRSSSRAGAVLLHSGPAAWSCTGAGHTTGPAARRTNSHDHPAWTDHHRAATARTGTTDALFKELFTGFAVKHFPECKWHTHQDLKKQQQNETTAGYENFRQ